MFLKYQHLERLGHDETDGILDGICHVFYKIDGTNGSVWFDEKKGIQAGSRNRVLSEDADNAGFCKYVYNNPDLIAFFAKYPLARLYGEWLVPHSLQTYRDDAWRKFYIFDVHSTIASWDMNDEAKTAIPYDVYKPWLDDFKLDYIPPLAIIKNPSEEDILRMLEKSGQFLVKDGYGIGEGVVVKNYDFVNKFGRQTWAKMVTNEFKTIHHREMGAPLINGTTLDEERAVEEFCTSAFIQKEKAKIELERGGWEAKAIPELLGRVWYEFVREEMWNIVKKYKNPKINFKLLQGLIIKKVKQEIGI